MKIKWFRYLRGVTPVLLLLTVLLPFAVPAQDKTAQKTETKASADTKEITLTLEGAIRGGRFFFKENAISFDTLNKYDWPTGDVFVNGKRWSELNKPFKLDFTPDFGKAVILEKQGGPVGRIYVMPREKMFALMIVPREQNPEETPFRVKLAVKNQVPHDDLPPDETPVSGGTTKSAAIRQPDPNKQSAAVEEHFALVLTGEIDGKGKFRLQSDRIEFVPDSASKPAWPDNVTVNGKPWEDPQVPFELDFVTDYATGKLTERTGTAAIGWRCIPVPDGDSVFDRYKLSVGELTVVGKQEGTASTFRASVSLRKYPRDYTARILAMLHDAREKSRKGELDSEYMSDEYLLSPDERKEVENWRAERQRDQLAWSSDRTYSTDGKDLPYLTRTAVLSPRDPDPDQFDVTVEADVNCNAVFAFLGDKIVYSDQQYPNDGKYPGHVRINGSAWRNLHLPFSLGSEVDPDCVAGIQVETEFYRYYLTPEKNRIVLGIVNHGPRDEEHVRIRLTLKKKAEPAKTK
ncbi:MAG: hypothetical protein IKC53_00955 [Lentisphaeria bacterium]|nr:hypothetical protein [Lentisphaeria bacterium]